MELKKIKDCLRHYNFVLDTCRKEGLFTIGRIKQFRAELIDIVKQIETIERWQKIEASHEQALHKHFVSDCQFESYAAFCIELDRQNLPILKYSDYLKIG